MSTIVVSKWNTTEAYRADPHVADEGSKLIADLEGVLANYHGFQIEKPEVGISVQVATSPEAYLKVAKDRELMGKIMDKLAVSRIDDNIERYHGVAPGDPFKALVGPVHEVSFFTLKSDTPEARAQMEEACAARAKISEGKMTYAWAVEDPKTILVLYSWDSVEAHKELAALPEVAEELKKLGELVDMHGGPLLHVELIKVE